MIRDQRTMLGARLLSTPADVRAYWEAYASRLGIPLVAQDAEVVAYVNESRWVADCPACRGGIACWPENPQAACLECGGVFAVSFPPPAEVAAGEAALSVRPAPETRNWNPLAEAVDELIAENIERGLSAPEGDDA